MTTTPALPTLPTNITAQAVNTFIKDVEGILVPILETYLQAQLPALALPVIKQIADGIVQLVCNELTKYIQTGATFTVIDAQTTIEGWSMSAALAALVAAEKTGNQNAINQALSVYQTAQSSLATDDGSASPSPVL